VKEGKEWKLPEKGGGGMDYLQQGQESSEASGGRGWILKSRKRKGKR